MNQHSEKIEVADNNSISETSDTTNYRVRTIITTSYLKVHRQSHTICWFGVSYYHLQYWTSLDCLLAEGHGNMGGRLMITMVRVDDGFLGAYPNRRWP